jgi:hypothetical protein
VSISLRGCEWLAFYIGKIRPMFAFIGSGKSLFLANNGKRYVPGKLTYTRYHSKSRISVGIKMTLGKKNNLSIVILCFD